MKDTPEARAPFQTQFYIQSVHPPAPVYFGIERQSGEAVPLVWV